MSEIRSSQFQQERLKSLHTPSAINELPQGWHWCGLDDVTEGVFDCPHSTPKHVAESQFYSVRTQDILGGKFDLKNCARVSEETYRSRISRAEPRFGDLVYSREGTYFGIAAEVPQNAFVCLGQRMVLIRPKQNLVHHSFLRWWLNSPVIANHIRGFYDGSVAERLNLPVIRTLPVAMPPLPEQKAIAVMLGSLDDKIELLLEENETLEALAQTHFKRWFIDFNFPDENGDPYKDSGGNMVASELGEIPEGWKVGNFEEDGFTLTMGQSPSGSSYNEEREGTLFFQGRAEFGWRFPSPRLYTTAPNRMAKEDDILLSVRAPVGDINLAIRACCVGRGLCAMSHPLSSYGLYKVKSLQIFFNQYNQEGTVFGSISKKDFLRRELLIPDSELAALFDQFTVPIDAKIKSNSEQIQTLTQLRDTLLPKLMKGEIRIQI